MRHNACLQPMLACLSVVIVLINVKNPNEVHGSRTIAQTVPWMAGLWG